MFKKIVTTFSPIEIYTDARTSPPIKQPSFTNTKSFLSLKSLKSLKRPISATLEGENENNTDSKKSKTCRF